MIDILNININIPQFYVIQIGFPFFNYFKTLSFYLLLLPYPLQKVSIRYKKYTNIWIKLNLSITYVFITKIKFHKNLKIQISNFKFKEFCTCFLILDFNNDLSQENYRKNLIKRFQVFYTKLFLFSVLLLSFYKTI